MATNFLWYCTCNADGVEGVSCVECAVGLGKLCTWSGEGAAGSGLLVAWAVALGFKVFGSGLRISFWVSSTVSFLLPSSVNKGRIFSLLHGYRQQIIFGASYSPSEASTGSSIKSS